MANTSCGCDSELGLPVGLTGAAGAPGFHSMSFSILGSPMSVYPTTYVEVGRFIFSNLFATPFTALKANVWVDGGTGGIRVIDLLTSTVVYENTSITSTSVTNIETAIGQSIYSVDSALLAVEIKVSAGQIINIASIVFYYNP